jgi:hypothetical protein
MPYDITQFSPGYGGTIDSSGNVKNIADTIDGSNNVKVSVTGGNVTLNATDIQIGAVELKDPTNENRASISSTGALTVAQQIASNTSSLLTLQNAATGLGNGTPIDVSGYSTLILYLTFSGTATVTFEVSTDNVNWGGISTSSPTASGNHNLTTNATGYQRINVAGFSFFRARISAYTSGSVTVTGVASTALFNDYNNTSFSIGTADNQSASTTVQPTSAFMYGSNGTTWDRVKTVNTGQLRTTLYSSTGGEILITNIGTGATDGNTLSSNGFIVASNTMGWAGTAFDRMRVGKVYKYIEYLNLADNTATTVWTPAAGRKFRLMAVQISASAASILHLRDGAGGTIFHTQRTAGIDSKYFDFGNGYISSTTNNVLEILNKSAATINVWVTAWGTEE